MKKLFTAFCMITCVAFMNSCTTKTANDQKTANSTIDDSHPLGQASYSDDVSDKNILQIAMGSKDHTTLVAAVQAAGIEHVLVNAGPLTVFAPTNEAFAKLPAGTIDNLLKPENKAQLANILTFHAAPGTYQGDALPSIMGIGQATGQKVRIEKTADGYTVNGSKIMASIKASNGIVHVIDGVLLPPETEK